MAYETLLTDLKDGVMTVTLNRPDKLNAFNTVMSRELIDFFQGVNAMDEVRAIVVTGAGRAYCAGADISGGSGAFKVWNDGDKPQKRAAGDSITLAIFNCLKPIIAHDRLYDSAAAPTILSRVISPDRDGCGLRIAPYLSSGCYRPSIRLAGRSVPAGTRSLRPILLQFGSS